MFHRHSWPVVAIRTPLFLVAFMAACVGVRLLQAAGALVFRFHPALYHACVSMTKTHFLATLTFLTALINPAAVAVTFDTRQLHGARFEVQRGRLRLTLAPNAVWISNHQIYTDWLFVWFLAYTGGLAGSVYIVLKENLARIPVLGAGMRVYRFMFLLRRWEHDKVRLTNQLLELDADARAMGPAAGVACVASHGARFPGVRTWPAGHGAGAAANYHLIIYPEGTVMLPHTRERSNQYCASVGRPPLRHVLLPRARGLFLMLRLLRSSVDVVYDVATGYTGLSADDYGEDVFTLKAFYLLGYGPRKINYAVRAWKLADIPLGDNDGVLDVDAVDPAVLARFDDWLYEQWLAKDELMHRFYSTGLFAAADDDNVKTVEAPFALNSRVEALAPYVLVLVLLLVLRWLYVAMRALARRYFA